MRTRRPPGAERLLRQQSGARRRTSSRGGRYIEQGAHPEFCVLQGNLVIRGLRRKASGGEKSLFGHAWPSIHQRFTDPHAMATGMQLGSRLPAEGRTRPDAKPARGGGVWTHVPLDACTRLPCALTTDMYTRVRCRRLLPFPATAAIHE